MTYNIALLLDPYRGIFKVVDTAGDYVEAWRRAAAARRMLQDGIFFVLGTETREDPKGSIAKHTQMPLSGAPEERECESDFTFFNLVDNRLLGLVTNG